MNKECKVCGEYFNTTLRGRYKYCSEKCAKIGNRRNIKAKKRVSTIKDLSTLEFNEPMQVEDVLDKARAEIENHCGLAKENHCKYCSYCNNLMGVREILEIIDKYKAELKGEIE